jgi:hypothetical protein
MVIDEGIFNPTSVKINTEEGFTLDVINGRQARAVKARRNRTVGRTAEFDG